MNKNGYIPIYKNHYLQQISFSLNDTVSILTKSDDIIEYVDVLVPLLFDTWLEVGPDINSEENNLDSTLNEESVTVLNCSLNILLLLWKFIQIYEKETSNYKLVS